VHASKISEKTHLYTVFTPQYTYECTVSSGKSASAIFETVADADSFKVTLKLVKGIRSLWKMIKKTHKCI